MPTLRDIFSREAIFALFYFIAAYKASPLVATVSDRVDLTILATLLGLVATVPLRARMRVPANRDRLRYRSAFLLFCLYAVFSYLTGASGENATLKLQRLLVFSSWALIGPLWLVCSLERLDRLLRLLLGFGALFVLTALLRFLTGYSQGASAGSDAYQAVGRYGGSTLVLLLALAGTGESRAREALRLGVTGLLLAAVILSMTRQAVVAILLSGLFLAWLGRNNPASPGRAARVIRAGLILGAVGLVTAVVALPGYDPSRLLRRMEVLTLDSEVLSENSRTVIYRAALEVWTEHPLIGAGIGSFPEVSGLQYRHAHDMPLELLSEFGVVGLVNYGFLLAVPFGILRRSSRGEVDRRTLALGGAWMFFVCCSLFSGDITENRHILIFSSLILARDALRAGEVPPPPTPFPIHHEVLPPDERACLGRFPHLRENVPLARRSRGGNPPGRPARGRRAGG